MWCQIVLGMTAKSFLTLFQLFISLAKKTLALWNAAIATASIACQITNSMHLLNLSFLCILIIYLAHFLCYVFKVTYLFLWRFWGGEGEKERFRWSRLLGASASPRQWKLVKKTSVMDSKTFEIVTLVLFPPQLSLYSQIPFCLLHQQTFYLGYHLSSLFTRNRGYLFGRAPQIIWPY